MADMQNNSKLSNFEIFSLTDKFRFGFNLDNYQHNNIEKHAAKFRIFPILSILLKRDNGRNELKISDVANVTIFFVKYLVSRLNLNFEIKEPV